MRVVLLLSQPHNIIVLSTSSPVSERSELWGGTNDKQSNDKRPSHKHPNQKQQRAERRYKIGRQRIGTNRPPRIPEGRRSGRRERRSRRRRDAWQVRTCAHLVRTGRHDFGAKAERSEMVAFEM